MKTLRLINARYEKRKILELKRLRLPSDAITKHPCDNTPVKPGKTYFSLINF